MNKYNYFLAGCNAGNALRKAWILSCFSVVRLEPYKGQKPAYPFELFADPVNGTRCFIDDHGGLVTLDDNDPNLPLLRFKEGLEITPESVPNCTEPLNTTCGNVLYNFMVLIFAFGNKIAFQSGQLDPDKIDGLIAKRLVEDPLPGAQSPTASLVPSSIGTGALFISEHKRYLEASYAITGLSSIATPALTERNISVNPEVVAMRDRLLEENKARLHDPAVIADIDKQLVAADKKWLQEDPEAGFLYQSKSFDNVRKKGFLLHGAEFSFAQDGQFGLITESLNEGWDINNLPLLANSLRDASYSRGALTAEGGAKVKETLRFLQNSQLSTFDCGSTLGILTKITEQNKSRYQDDFAIIDNASVQLTPETLAQYIGQSLIIRSPLFCKVEHTDFCVCCMGRRFEGEPTALGVRAAEISSAFQNAQMKKMHSSVLKTTHFDYRTNFV